MTQERTEQLAVLLNLIGDEAVNTAMSGMEPSQVDYLTSVLNEFKSDPPSPSETHAVVEDFERFFMFAMEQLKDELQDDEETKKGQQSDEDDLEFENELPEAREFPKPEFTGDAVRDLNLLHPYQVATAIGKDNTVAIAVVVNILSDAHAAKTMELLETEVRLNVFLELAQPTAVSEIVRQHILDAALKSASQVEQRVEEESQVGQLVSLVRSMPKKMRETLVDKLVEQDEALANEVRAEMYRIEDLLLIDDRQVQKILAQSDSDSLVTVLVNANEEMRAKVFSNVSKRARQTIEEEMEYKSGVKEEEIEAAEKKITGVIAELDAAGEIDFE